MIHSENGSTGAIVDLAAQGPTDTKHITANTSLRCASAIQIVRPSESMADTQPQLQPALLRLSAMIFAVFHLDFARIVAFH